MKLKAVNDGIYVIYFVDYMKYRFCVFIGYYSYIYIAMFVIKLSSSETIDLIYIAFIHRSFTYVLSCIVFIALVLSNMQLLAPSRSYKCRQLSEGS